MQRFAMRRVGLVVAVIITAFAVSPATAQTPSALSDTAAATEPAFRVPATTTPPDPTPPGPALLISDSAWLSFKLYGAMDSVQGFEHTFSLASCRRRVSTSCSNRNGYVPVTLIEELRAHPDFDTLIVATGYNDSDGNFVQEIDDIVTTARSLGYTRIVWLTLRSNVTYESPDDTGFAEVFERSNATLEQIVADGSYPEIVIADWATFAREQTQWFADDGIHLRRAGSYAAGDYISRKMAFLDGQPCPQPAFAGGPTPDPCLDPDVHGPVIDLESLYPLTSNGPDANFQLFWEGSGSWPAPPWWELEDA